MNKRLILVLALAFAVGISFAAYAEVQNVKVSGDLSVMAVARNNFDLTKQIAKEADVLGTNNLFNDRVNNIFSIARVRIDADLTDNVIATVRLLNERTWNGESKTADAANSNIGLNTANNTANLANENKIDLDLAYVTLKEFLYSPLSLKIGRQELMFGNGLIVGDPDTNLYSGATSLAEGDLSARKAFDAVRATLDYKPLVLDLVYAKIEEGAVNLNDDVTLTGINANYELNKNTVLEGYFFSKVKGSDAAGVYNIDANAQAGTIGGPFSTIKNKPDMVNTIGMRAVDKTVKNLTVEGQLAYQFGTYNPKFDTNARWDTSGGGVNATNSSAKITDRSAWAAQLKANYALKDAVKKIAKYEPAVAVGYTYLSGADRDLNGSKGSYKGWDPMFENITEGHILNAIFANTNTHRTLLSLNGKITDDIKAKVDYVAAWFAKRYPSNRIVNFSGVAGTTQATSGYEFYTNGKKWIGHEIDATLTYDYTEDVQFGLTGGVFLTGKGIRNALVSGAPANTNQLTADATEVIGSMKVTF